MATITRDRSTSIERLSKDLLESFDQVFGLHPGFRPAHAKGLMCSGTFAPKAEAKKLTGAPTSRGHRRP